MSDYAPLIRPTPTANSEGIEHYNQEHWDVALGHFVKAVEADPASAEAHYNLALALDKTDKRKVLGHVKMLKGDM